MQDTLAEPGRFVMWVAKYLNDIYRIHSERQKLERSPGDANQEFFYVKTEELHALYEACRVASRLVGRVTVVGRKGEYTNVKLVFI